jgi:hypothetical protein
MIVQYTVSIRKKTRTEVKLKRSIVNDIQPSGLERLTTNAKVVIVLGSIPASSDTVESEGAADEAVLNKVLSKRFKKSTV